MKLNHKRLLGSLFGIVMALSIVFLAWIGGMIPEGVFERAYWSARAKTKAIGKPEISAWQDAIQYDASIGWRGKHNKDLFLQAEEVFDVKMGSDGWRGSRDFASADVVVFGDSFAFAYGVGGADHFQALTTSCRTKAIGVPGYNLAQELMLMREYRDQIRGKLVVWFVFYGNDFYESVQPNMMTYTTPYAARKDGQWHIRTDHINEAGFEYESDRHGDFFFGNLGAACCTDASLTQTMFDATRYLLGEGQELCKELGCTLVIYGIQDIDQMTESGIQTLRKHLSQLHPGQDWKLDPDLPDDRLRAICQDLGLPFVRLQDQLTREDYLQNRHWSPSGNHKVAAQIESDWKLYQ